MKKLLMVLFIMSSVSTVVYAEDVTSTESTVAKDCRDVDDSSRCNGNCSKTDAVSTEVDKTKSPTASEQ